MFKKGGATLKPSTVPTVMYSRGAAIFIPPKIGKLQHL
jgi:hypothetical protein